MKYIYQEKRKKTCVCVSSRVSALEKHTEISQFSEDSKLIHVHTMTEFSVSQF